MRQQHHSHTLTKTAHQQAIQEASILSVHVTPNAKMNAITGCKENVWHIKIAAPPADGKANEELIKFFSSAINLHKNALCVIKGQTSRNKLISVEGLSPAEIEMRLSALVQK